MLSEVITIGDSNTPRLNEPSIFESFKFHHENIPIYF